MRWLTLIISLPTENASARMRAWRALKAAGAAVLRDGVYLLPELGGNRATLDAIAADVRANGGTAYVMVGDGDGTGDFMALFDRRAEFAELLAEIAASRTALSVDTAADTLKQARKLRKSFALLAGIDFFPGHEQDRAAEALDELEAATSRELAPDEPQAVVVAIPRLAVADYHGRAWATRRRPWVDRLASAWLIQRFIDPAARFIWLVSPDDCPADALGFDFDGAAFTHVGALVTFETLLASFGFDAPALQRIAALVRHLDVGGVPPPEASGVERVLAGMRHAIAEDDQLLAAASAVFDGLCAAFEQDISA